jgi:hypothetical protein
LASRATATRLVDPPTARLAVLGDTATDVTTGTTVTETVSALLQQIAVATINAVPTARAVTRPNVSTVATMAFEVLHEILTLVSLRPEPSNA